MADLKGFIIFIIPLMPQRLHGKLHQTKMFSQYRCPGNESHINFRLKSVQLFKRSQLFSEIQNKMVED